jgi:nitroimidazol reductase NimA-like FMN-containing flavoprotein (pyridoxamine 5'-phosphate oxidase superfamily)
MDRNIETAKIAIKEILQSQKFGVLATYSGDHTYATLVGFVASDDLKTIVFATIRDTRKFRHLCIHPNVSMLIDTRTNRTDDFRDAQALTILGKVSEIVGGQKEGCAKAYLVKHPQLSEFIADPNCALIRLLVKKYILVSRFQEVLEIDCPNA